MGPIRTGPGQNDAMSLAAGPSLALAAPTGPAYVAVLLAHMAAAVVGFGTVLASGVQAGRLGSLQAGELPSGSLLRFYSPGANWAGRVIYAVPVLGVALVAQSRRAFSLSDGWVVGGLALWVVAALAAELVLWPAERRVQRALAGTFEVDRAASGPGVRVTDPETLTAAAGPCRPVARQASVAAGLAVACFLAATVLMVAQP